MAFTFAVGISIVLYFLFFPCLAYTEIVVYDDIARQDEEIILRAQTRGKLFSKGGEVVELYVNGKPLGRRLSGGDGFVFQDFIPRSAGLYRIQAKTREEEGRGLLLTLQKGEGIVFIEIESSLMEGLFSRYPRKNSQKAVALIAKKFPVVCLQTGFAGITQLKRWLNTNGFPEIPVLSWREGDIFPEIEEKGLGIQTVIGNEMIIRAARRYGPKIFSFRETEDAEFVSDWDEVARKLLLPGNKEGLVDRNPVKKK